MAIDIKSPQFPESIFEGTLSNWLKKEGQEIKQDEVLDLILSTALFGWANRLMHILGDPVKLENDNN